MKIVTLSLLIASILIVACSKRSPAQKRPPEQLGLFSAGAEGWTTFETNGVTGTVRHDPAGFIEGNDIYQGSDFFFVAPQSYVDLLHSASPNATFAFDFYTTATDRATYDTLVVESPSLTIVLPKTNPPIDEWKHYSYSFMNTEGWKVGKIGKNGTRPATPAEIQQVLATATKLYIRGEWKTGPDFARLDNVSFTP